MSWTLLCLPALVFPSIWEPHLIIFISQEEDEERSRAFWPSGRTLTETFATAQKLLFEKSRRWTPDIRRILHRGKPSLK